jgi:hypothetical protein
MTRKNIFVFRVVLENSKPRIWRNLRVPGHFTLADLHRALQIAFGWTNSHLHSFTIGAADYVMDSEVDQDFFVNEGLSEDDYCLDDLDLDEKQIFSYLYDFGDSWQHTITVSKVLPFQEDLASPLCLGGKNAGPPEDCGGVWGYANMLEILRDPKHQEYEETLEWAGDVDPQAFDLEEVNRHLKKAFGSTRKSRAGGEKRSARKKSSGDSSFDNPDEMFRRLYRESLLDDDIEDDEETFPETAGKFFPRIAESSDEKKAGEAAGSSTKKADGKTAGRADGSSGRKAVTAKPLPTGKLKKLYALMGRVKELRPWEKLWDTELTIIEFPGQEEPVLCSVMGRGGESYGILVYPGFESIQSFFRLAEEESDNPFTSLAYQNCLVCQLGGRDEVFPEERARLKELGISFRGKHDWVYFRKLRPGCQPWHINSKDADILIEVLTRFIEAYGAFAGGLAVNFDDDEVLVQRYSEKDKKWITRSEKLPPIPARINEFHVKSDDVEPLRFKKQLKTTVEIETLYFPQALGKNEEGVPVLIRFSVIVDNRSGVVLDQLFLDADDAGDHRMLDMLINFVAGHGRPETVMVRDKFAAAVLGDFCGKVGIRLVHSKGMPKTDEFVRNMPNFLNPLAFPG